MGWPLSAWPGPFAGCCGVLAGQASRVVRPGQGLAGRGWDCSGSCWTRLMAVPVVVPVRRPELGLEAASAAGPGLPRDEGVWHREVLGRPGRAGGAGGLVV